jgi:hypothetical protein
MALVRGLQARWQGPLLGALVATALLGAPGCYLGTAGASRDGGQRDQGSGNGDGGGGAVTGLPCDVANVLSSKCVSCHSSPPSGGAPMSLASYSDLTATSAGFPGQTMAQRAVARMQDAMSPMPPGAATDPTGAGIIDAWITAGYPQGDCGPDGGTNPYNTPPTCTSGAYIRGTDGLGAEMKPGGACISCHRSEGLTEPEAIFTIAGTVFPTAHEYDDCVSTAAGRGQVVITDADNLDHALTIGASGNFYLRQAISLPYRAKVVVDGRERAMSSTQQSGDCNSCHTLNGTNDAPGRIMLP